MQLAFLRSLGVTPADYRARFAMRVENGSKRPAPQVEIDTGKVLNEMKTTSIVVNEKLDPRVFSPPVFTPTPLQKLLSDLFGERTDVNAVIWTYGDFRRAHPDIEADEGMQVIGYQMLKMGDYPASVALLSANAVANPQSSGAAFGLGRAWRETKEFDKARAQFETALRLNPANERARCTRGDQGGESTAS